MPQHQRHRLPDLLQRLTGNTNVVKQGLFPWQSSLMDFMDDTRMAIHELLAQSERLEQQNARLMAIVEGYEAEKAAKKDILCTKTAAGVECLSEIEGQCPYRHEISEADRERWKNRPCYHQGQGCNGTNISTGLPCILGHSQGAAVEQRQAFNTRKQGR